MNKVLGALIATVALTTFANADPLVDQVRAPVVRLDAFCSGTVVQSHRDQKSSEVGTFILTAKHCVVDDKDNMIPIAKDTYDGLNKTGKKIYDGDVYGTSYKSDLALIKLRDKNTLFDAVAVVAPSDINLQFGQEVIVEGYPVGMSMTETVGKLGYKEEQPAFSDLSQSKIFYRATPDIVGGSSGSGMFTLDGGSYKLIGVTTGGYAKASYINYFTPVEEINDYLKVALPSIEDKKDGTGSKGL